MSKTIRQPVRYCYTAYFKGRSQTIYAKDTREAKREAEEVFRGARPHQIHLVKEADKLAAEYFTGAYA